jgi:hypothetical protein
VARIVVCAVDVTAKQLLSLGTDERLRSVTDALKVERVGGRLTVSVDEAGRIHIEFDAHGASDPVVEAQTPPIEEPGEKLETEDLRLTVDPPEILIAVPTEEEMQQYGTLEPDKGTTSTT